MFKDGRERLVGLDWRNRVKELWERCGGKCEWIDWPSLNVQRLCCREAQDPHHIVKRSVLRDDRLSNLQALCRYHHDLLDNRKIRSDKAERR